MSRLLSVPFLCCLVVVLAPTAGRAGWAVLFDKTGNVCRDVPDETYKKLVELTKQGAEFKSISFTANGWAILYDKNSYFCRNVPDDAFKKLGELAKQGSELKSMTFTPDGGWAILFDKNGYVAGNIPDDAFKKLGDLAKQGSSLKTISFTPGGGWAILFDKNGYVTSNIPDEPFKSLGDLAKKGADLQTIAFPPDGGWVILFDNNGYLARGIPDETFNKLGEIAKGGSTWKSLAFTAVPVLKLSQDDKATRDKVLARMAHYKVPGMSIAVIQNNEIVVARGYGVVQGRGNKAVTSDTLFQAASISKTLAAVAALRLVQDGKMDLDGDLNKYLTSWKIPDNEFTKTKQPTMRLVVTHSAGFNVSGFPGYAAGTKVPTLLEILEGKAPANTPAIRVESLPGSKYAYSGGGFTVLQQAIIDVGGKPFPKIMHDLVLAPAGMKSSSFDQPLAAGSEAVAAVGHQNGSPIAGKWHTHPEMAAAGLWTTPSDLARFALAVQRAAKGERDALLSPKLTKEMLTRQIENHGLGFALGGRGKNLFFTHNGSNVGFESVLIGYAETGQGVVIMCNANNAGSLMNEMVQNVRSEYGWPE